MAISERGVVSAVIVQALSRQLQQAMTSAQTLCLLLSFLGASLLSCANNSTLKLRVNRPAFDFFSRAAHRVIDQEVIDCSLPNISISLAGPGTGNLSAYNLLITKFLSPKFDLTINSRGLQWKSRGGAVKMEGDFTVDYTLLLPLSQTGWFTALATDIRISLAATAASLDGRPQFAIQSCETEIEFLDMHIGGGVLEWLVNLFSSLLSDQVRKTLNQQACNLARSLLLQKANAFLHSLPTHVSLGNNFFLHYYLQQNPSFTQNYAELETAAAVTVGDKEECDRVSSALDDSDPTARMLTLWISEHIPNCLFKTAFQHLQLSVTLTHKNVPSLERYLKTTCLLTCLGAYLPLLARQFPNRYVSLTLMPAAEPRLSLSDSARLLTSLALDLYIFPKADNPNVLARLQLETTALVQPYLKEHRVRGKISHLTMNATQTFSRIGNFSPSVLHAFSEVFKGVTMALLGAVLERGLPIPVFDNLSISDVSTVTILRDQLRLSIDLQEEESSHRQFRPLPHYIIQ